MKKLGQVIQQLHIYLGLFCLPYLLIFSLSSLNFNHHFLSDQPLPASPSTTHRLSLDLNQDLEQIANQVKDELDLFGWFLPGDSSKDTMSIYLEITQPGKKYEIMIEQDGQTTVSTQPQSTAHLFKLLHFLGEDIPDAPWWINSWKQYQNLTVYAMLFWVVSGIYMWLTKRKRPVIESWALWGFSILSILYILVIWLRK